MKQLGLDSFDGKLIDGLLFCRKVYDYFAQVRDGPEGKKRVLRRSDKGVKRLLEELIPLARYIQHHYSESFRMKVRWYGGSQQFDAALSSTGPLVTLGFASAKNKIEITTAVHQRNYLTRALLASGRAHYGSEATRLDKKSRQIVSKPQANNIFDIYTALSERIISRLNSKAKKPYPEGTILIINCITESFMDEWVWNEVVKSVRVAGAKLAFDEIFLLDNLNYRETSLLYRNVINNKK